MSRLPRQALTSHISPQTSKTSLAVSRIKSLPPPPTYALFPFAGPPPQSLASSRNLEDEQTTRTTSPLLRLIVNVHFGTIPILRESPEAGAEVCSLLRVDSALGKIHGRGRSTFSEEGHQDARVA